MTAPGLRRRHDRELLDALEAHPAEAFQGEIWRVTAQGRDALHASSAGGRWIPQREFEVLCTSLAWVGALAEIGDRLALEPVWPSRIAHTLHRITARTDRTLRFADLDGLAPLGVGVRRYAGFDYAATQAVAAAAYILEFDGLIVPSARGPALNLVIFTEKPGPGAVLEMAASEPVDGSAWPSGRHRSPPRAPTPS